MPGIVSLTSQVALGIPCVHPLRLELEVGYYAHLVFTQVSGFMNFGPGLGYQELNHRAISPALEICLKQISLLSSVSSYLNSLPQLSFPGRSPLPSSACMARAGRPGLKKVSFTKL